MATVGAAIALPLVRKRLRIPGPVTLAVAASGPLAVAVLGPRTRKRDVALFAMQMWAFTVVHEMPYDDPEALRRRLYIRYPIKVEFFQHGGGSRASVEWTPPGGLRDVIPPARLYPVN